MQRFAFASVALIAVFSAAALAAPASVRVQGTAPNGSGGYVVRAVGVQFDDGELATNDGAKTVLARISNAAENVCVIGPVRIGMADQIARCKRDAVKQAVVSLDVPALTAAAGIK